MTKVCIKEQIQKELIQTNCLRNRETFYTYDMFGRQQNFETKNQYTDTVEVNKSENAGNIRRINGKLNKLLSYSCRRGERHKIIPLSCL
jgi:hypothetical protein